MAVIQNQTLDADSAAAFRSVRAAKNVFMIVALLAIVSVPFTTIMTAFVGVLDKPSVVQPAAPPASSPASAPAGTDVSTAPAASAPSAGQAQAQTAESRSLVAWRYTLISLTTLFSILGPLGAMLAVVSLLMAAGLSIVSRSGGAGGFFSAFFWSLLMLVTLVPWQNIMPGVASGISANLWDIVFDGRILGSAGTTTKILFYWRYLAYPALALAFWLMVMLKFARGYSAMNISTTVKPATPYPIVPNGSSVTDLRRPTEPPSKI